MSKMSVCVITRNEETDIARCLASLSFADEIVVVDSGSEDRTVDFAKRFTDKVYFNDFKDFASQKNFAVSKTSGEWILSVDADEVVTEELAVEAKNAVESAGDICAFNVNRINYMYGRRLEHFSQPDYNIRLFRKDVCAFTQPVHEYVECDGEVGTLKTSMLHYSIASFAEHMEKARMYTSLEMEVVRGKKPIGSFMMFAKMMVNPPLRFCQNYFLLKGILEGWIGLVISFNAAIVEFMKWYKCYKWSLKKERQNG